MEKNTFAIRTVGDPSTALWYSTRIAQPRDDTNHVIQSHFLEYIFNKFKLIHISR